MASRSTKAIVRSKNRKDKQEIHYSTLVSKVPKVSAQKLALFKKFQEMKLGRAT